MKKLFVILMVLMAMALTASAQYYGYGPRYYNGFGNGFGLGITGGIYGGGYGYGYGGYGYGYGMASGLKFDLDQFPKREQREVQRGVVQVDSANKGIVDRYDSWHDSPVILIPGRHFVRIDLPDGRFYESFVNILPGQVEVVYPTFNDRAGRVQSAPQSGPTERRRLQDELVPQNFTEPSINQMPQGVVQGTGFTQPVAPQYVPQFHQKRYAVPQNVEPVRPVQEKPQEERIKNPAPETKKELRRV